MNEAEMLEQLEDLIHDRKILLGDDNNPKNPFKKDIEALNKVIHDFKLFRDAAWNYAAEKGETLDIFVNENVKLRRVKILKIWKTGYGDVRCKAVLYKGKRIAASIVVSYGEDEIKSLMKKIYGKTKNVDKYKNVPFKVLIYESFDELVKLPKLSKCSDLLKEIFDAICKSETSICHITEKDWINYYAKKYSKKDFELLKEEIKKYKLEDVIKINDCECKLIVTGDLETMFNDNRKKITRNEICR